MPRSHIAVEPRVRRVIATHLGVDPGSLQPDTDLRLDAVALRGVARVARAVVLGRTRRAGPGAAAFVPRAVDTGRAPRRRAQPAGGPGRPRSGCVSCRSIPAVRRSSVSSSSPRTWWRPSSRTRAARDQPGGWRSSSGRASRRNRPAQVERLLAAARAAGLSVRVQGGAPSRGATPARRTRRTRT